MVAQDGNLLPCGRGPQADGVVPCGDDCLTVGAERGGDKPALMATQDGDLLARTGVPQPGSLVQRGGDDDLRVGAEGSRIDESLMAAKGGDRRAGGGLPQPDGVVQ